MPDLLTQSEIDKLFGEMMQEDAEVKLNVKEGGQKKSSGKKHIYFCKHCRKTIYFENELPSRSKKRETLIDMFATAPESNNTILNLFVNTKQCNHNYISLPVAIEKSIGHYRSSLSDREVDALLLYITTL